MFDNFQPQDLAWIILLLPLLSAAVITIFTKRDGKVSSTISITAVALSFVLSLMLFLILQEPLRMTNHADAASFSWLNIGDFQVDLGLRLDPLSLIMLLVVTGVGGLIHIYSAGYMRED